MILSFLVLIFGLAYYWLFDDDRNQTKARLVHAIQVEKF